MVDGRKTTRKPKSIEGIRFLVGGLADGRGLIRTLHDDGPSTLSTEEIYRRSSLPVRKLNARAKDAILRFLVLEYLGCPGRRCPFCSGWPGGEEWARNPDCHHVECVWRDLLALYAPKSLHGVEPKPDAT